MSLSEQIDSDIIIAIKSGDTTKRDVLRYLKSSLKNYQIESQKAALSDEDVITVVAREIKRRRESVEAYKQAGKNELAEDEAKEIEVLSLYQPAQLSEREITGIIDDYFSKNPTEGLQIGQVIGALSPQLKGKADMGLVAQLIKQRLG